MVPKRGVKFARHPFPHNSHQKKGQLSSSATPELNILLPTDAYIYVTSH